MERYSTNKQFTKHLPNTFIIMWQAQSQHTINTHTHIATFMNNSLCCGISCRVASGRKKSCQITGCPTCLWLDWNMNGWETEGRNKAMMSCDLIQSFYHKRRRSHLTRTQLRTQLQHIQWNLSNVLAVFPSVLFRRISLSLKVFYIPELLYLHYEKN